VIWFDWEIDMGTKMRENINLIISHLDLKLGYFMCFQY
jgi:hypothetical protein